MAAVFMVGAAAADVKSIDLQAEVDRVRTEYNLVGFGAVIATSKDGVTNIAVSGVRVIGKADPVRVTDSWHIGSNTKMLTALLYVIVRGQGMARRQRAALQQVRSEAETQLRAIAGKSPVEQIADAKVMLDAGTISADEFARLKAKALA